MIRDGGLVDGFRGLPAINLGNNFIILFGYYWLLRLCTASHMGGIFMKVTRLASVSELSLVRILITYRQFPKLLRLERVILRCFLRFTESSGLASFEGLRFSRPLSHLLLNLLFNQLLKVDEHLSDTPICGVSGRCGQVRWCDQEDILLFESRSGRYWIFHFGRPQILVCCPSIFSL